MGWYYSLRFKGENLKLICLVLQHKQKLKLNFKSQDFYLWVYARWSIHTNYHEPCLVCPAMEEVDG